MMHSWVNRCGGKITMQVKIGAWLALLCCLCSLANMKSVDFDIKQIISSVTYGPFFGKCILLCLDEHARME